MKFFKHFTDSHRGKSLQQLRRSLGFEGVGRYWTFVELCVEKLEKGRNEELTDCHCEFEFERTYLMQSLGYASHKQVSNFLKILAELGLITDQARGHLEPTLNTPTPCGDASVSSRWLEANAMVFRCSMPKLLESMDRDSKRARTMRVGAAPKKKKKIKDKELDKELDNVKSIKVGNGGKIISGLQEIYQSYPRKEGKTKGIEKLLKDIETEAELSDLDLAVQNYSNSCIGKDPKYIKMFSTFASEWRDWIEVQQSVPSGGMVDLSEIFGKEA